MSDSDVVSLTPFKFESETGKNDDVWAFYRCLMRGFLLATYEQELETINANPSTNADENNNNRLIILGQIGRLLRGMDKSVLHIDNVFQFDEFAITECDLIVGMLTRISRWFKHKVQLDVPRQYFSDIDTSKVALESSADYFVHQVDSAFKDLNHKTPDPAVEPIVVKDIDEFIFHLTSDMNNVGRSKVLAAYDAVRGSITAEKARAAAGKVTRKVRIVIDKTRQVGNTAVEGVKKFTRGRQLAYRKWDAKRQSEKAEKAQQALAEIKAKQQVPLQQHGGAPGKPGIDLLYPLKQYRELRATGKIEVMQKPNMTAVEYFEKLPVMLTRTGATGNDQVFPALFGHPLLLYLPFARAFGCVIEVYSRSQLSGVSDEYDDESAIVLKYLFPSKPEIEKSIRSMPVIRIMDDNPYNASPDLKDILTYPNFLTYQDQYMANLSLFLPYGGSDVADKALGYLANKVKLSSQMQSNGDKLQHLEDQYNIADAKYKDANALMVKAKKAMDRAQASHPTAEQNEPPTQKQATKEEKVYNTAKQDHDAAYKRFLNTQNRMNEMASKINSQNAGNDSTVDASRRQEVINELLKYKVPAPAVVRSVKTSKPLAIAGGTIKSRPRKLPTAKQQIKIMTFNVCHETFSGKRTIGEHCVKNINPNPSWPNPCTNNIKQAILNKISEGVHVIFLQEGIEDFSEFFGSVGLTTPLSHILEYNPTSGPGFFVYTVKILNETMVTMCSKAIFPNQADIIFMGSLASESKTPSGCDEFLPKIATIGDSSQSFNIIGGARPYIVLVFHAKKIILINIHSPHSGDVFKEQIKPDSSVPDYTKSGRVKALNSQYPNLQEYAFTKLGELLRTRLHKEIAEYRYDIVIGGDFNNPDPFAAGLFRTLNIPVTRSPLNKIPTLSRDDMKTYATVSDHIYSTKRVVEYSVHPTSSVKKDTTSGKFLFSDHLPVYATIEI